MDPLTLLLILSVFLLALMGLVLLVLARRLLRRQPAPPRKRPPRRPEVTPATREGPIRSVLEPTPVARETPSRSVLEPTPPAPEPTTTAPAPTVSRRPVVVSRDDKPPAPVTPPKPARSEAVAPPPRPTRAEVVVPDALKSTSGAQPITILIVDDIDETREGLRKLLRFEDGMEVVGEARSGREGIEAARALEPDIVLMDINMPDVDGVTAAETITREVPQAQLIMMSVQSDADYLRRSMLAGARDFLIKPFGSEDLVSTIHRVYELGATRQRVAAPPPELEAAPGLALARRRRAHIIVVYSPQPGAGSTTLATNLAVAIQQEGGQKVALVDGHLQFGDVGLYLNLQSGRSIVDLASSIDELDSDFVEDMMLPHPSGLRALLAPPRPELADLVTAEPLRKILTTMAQAFDVIIIDSWSFLHEITLTYLEMCDRLLLVATQEIPTVKNVKQFLDVLEAIDFPMSKLALVLNRVDPRAGIDPLDIERSIQQPFTGQVAANWQLATYAANRGMPFVMSNRDTRLAQGVIALAPLLLARGAEAADEGSA